MPCSDHGATNLQPIVLIKQKELTVREQVSRHGLCDRPHTTLEGFSNGSLRSKRTAKHQNCGERIECGHLWQRLGREELRCRGVQQRRRRAVSVKRSL
jgi:hypothetical protein